MKIHTEGIYGVSPDHVFSYVLLGFFLERMYNHIGCICGSFLYCVSPYMCFQISAIGESITTNVAFFVFLSTVPFHMLLKMPFLRRGVVALFTFVRFLSTVYHGVLFEIA